MMVCSRCSNCSNCSAEHSYGIHKPRGQKWNALRFTISPVFFCKHLINNILSLKIRQKVSTLSTPLGGFFLSCDQKCRFFQRQENLAKWNYLKMSIFHGVPRGPCGKMECLPPAAAKKQARPLPKNHLADFLAFGIYRFPKFRTFLLFLTAKLTDNERTH